MEVGLFERVGSRAGVAVEGGVAKGGGAVQALRQAIRFRKVRRLTRVHNPRRLRASAAESGDVAT